MCGCGRSRRNPSETRALFVSGIDRSTGPLGDVVAGGLGKSNLIREVTDWLKRACADVRPGGLAVLVRARPLGESLTRALTSPSGSRHVPGRLSAADSSRDIGGSAVCSSRQGSLPPTPRTTLAATITPRRSFKLELGTPSIRWVLLLKVSRPNGQSRPVVVELD